MSDFMLLQSKGILQESDFLAEVKLLANTFLCLLHI